jgi:membrane-bound serine protease (ClpP class)
MEWYIAVFFIVGTVLFIIELFMPGFGVFGVSGLSLLVLSCILRASIKQPADDPLVQIFQMILVEAFIIGICLLILVITAKNKKLRSSAFALYDTAVATDFSDGTEDFSPLIGREGMTITELRPSGKVAIDGKTYDVVAKNFFIDRDKSVSVVSVEGVKIEVDITNNGG